MYFVSTRGKERVIGSEAVVKGLAADGGLFVPETFPTVTAGDINAMRSMSYAERAAEILHRFFDEYDKAELLAACKAAYGQFERGDAAPLVKIKDGLYVLELFHGPTCAFKDMALTVLPYLLRKGCDLCGIKEKVLVLVATSGDTGKAALEGFKNAEGIDVMVLYPEDGVSKMQKLQMCTQEGSNVNVLAVSGNFDDCQRTVKTIFSSKEYAEQLAKEGYRLSSANSINFGRLAPQIVYYFSTYIDLLTGKQIEYGDPVNFTVPTGNFGDILAAYYAKRMGLPLGKLICASNRNHILTDFFQSGVYDTHREFIKTMSPSMDILVSSNLERLLYEITDRNAERTAELMRSLSQSGKYEVTPGELARLQGEIWAGFAGEDETIEAMYDFFSENGYTADTHTGVALYVQGLYKDAFPRDKNESVIVSTANPYKFPQDVYYAVTGNDIKDSFKCIKRLNQETAMPVPKAISRLRDKPLRFKKSAPASKVFDEVLAFVKR